METAQTEQRNSAEDAEALWESVAPDFKDAFQQAVMSTSFIGPFTVPKETKVKFAGAIYDVINKFGFRACPKDRVCEHEDSVPEHIRQAIVSGEMDLVDLCQSDEIACKHISESYLQPHGVMANTKVGRDRLSPFSAVKFHENKTNKAKLPGEDGSKYINVMDLFDAGCRVKSDLRVSLPTMLVTLNNIAKKPHDAETYFFPDHPLNRTSQSSQRTESGPAYTGINKIANLWNSTVWMHHGCPEKDTDAYEECKKDMFTDQDVFETIGAFNLLTKHHTEKTDELMKLAHGHFPEKYQRQLENNVMPKEHINTIHSAEEKDRRLAALPPVSNDFWEVREHQTHRAAVKLGVGAPHKMVWANREDRPNPVSQEQVPKNATKQRKAVSRDWRRK